MKKIYKPKKKIEIKLFNTKKVLTLSNYEYITIIKKLKKADCKFKIIK